MEQFCVVIYETAAERKKTLHDSLVAYSVAENVEIIIKWLKPDANDDQITAACTAAQMAFLHADDTERAAKIGTLLYEANPSCALVYYGYDIPQNRETSIAYFCSLFPSRPVLYLDRPTQREYCQTIRTVFKRMDGQPYFRWETRGVKYRVPYSSILYFRSERNYAFVRLKNGEEYAFLGKLSNIEAMIPETLFVRVHQSYLINRKEILLIDKQKKSVRLNNGEEVFISKAHYKETLEI